MGGGGGSKGTITLGAPPSGEVMAGWVWVEVGNSAGWALECYLDVNLEDHNSTDECGDESGAKSE